MDEPIQLSDSCFKDFTKIIHAYTKINISLNRKIMIESRLRKRVNALGLKSYEEYLSHLKNTASEKNIFIDLVTTNETYFFRTARVWEYIEKTFIPQWYVHHPKEILRIWSAAASSGDEAHSLGIICQEFKSKNTGFNYQILGTDISEEMIRRCKEGLYSGRAIEGFKKQRADLFLKYMQPQPNDQMSLIPAIRAQMKFQQHNLFEVLNTIHKFDLVLLRNVLIYFTPEDQETLLSNIARSLKDEAILIIGESESLANIKTSFDMIEPLVYSQKPTAASSGHRS